MLVITAAVSLALAQVCLGGGPLQTGVVLQTSITPAETNLAFARIKATGASRTTILLKWRDVAKKRPADPTNPADPAYSWSDFDQKVVEATAHGLEVMVTVYTAPKWVQQTPNPADPADGTGGPFRPSPADFAAFVRAAAARYDGSFAGLPRIRYWQLWIEPNATTYLTPQFTNGAPASPAWYRQLLNAGAAAVKAVDQDNVVVAGSLTPFAQRTDGFVAIAPLAFMRELFCLGPAAAAGCAPVHLDVWAHHPYTSGGPTHSAGNPDDVSLGDLGRMRQVLDQAAAQGRIDSGGHPVAFWVNEFSWDSDPPDTSGTAVPPVLEARWVAEAMYRAWGAGVSLFVWHQLRDLPYPEKPYQGGLYYAPGATIADDTPKPALLAFRFPFVAFRPGAGISVWGRTPEGRPGFVFVDRKVGSAWRPIGLLRTDANGIFQAHITPQAGVRRLSAAVQRRPPATHYRRTVLEDSPTSYWRLDDRRPALARDERGLAHAAYSGGAVPVARAALLRGGRAVRLDGRDGSVSLGPVGSPSTIEAWIRTTQAGGPVFSNRDTAGGLLLGLDSTGAALVQGSLFPLLGGTWVADSRWHQLVYTRDGPLVRLFVDGSLEQQAFAPPAGDGGPAALGYDAVLGRHFRGSVDEFAVYDHPLTAEQVRSHFVASGRNAKPATRFLTDITADPGPFLRARLLDGSEASLPFSLTAPPDRAVNPFGG
jgi:hypothetical protein